MSPNTRESYLAIVRKDLAKLTRGELEAKCVLLENALLTAEEIDTANQRELFRLRLKLNHETLTPLQRDDFDS